jgi:hypothetical protein
MVDNAYATLPIIERRWLCCILAVHRVMRCFVDLGESLLGDREISGQLITKRASTPAQLGTDAVQSPQETHQIG